MTRGNPALSDRRDRLKQLRAFCETARHGSISRAAERLGSSQPAVSMQVRALEEELGVSLFERRGPRIALTRVGQSLYRAAVPVVEGLTRLPALFAEEREGVAPRRLRVGAGETSAAYLLPAALERFRKRHPGARIEVRTGTGPQRLEWLLRFELDAAVGVVDAGALSIAINAVIEVGGWSVLKRYVEAGFGISVVPSLVLSPTDRLSVVALEWDEPPRSFGVYTRSDRHLTPAARRFLEVLIPNVPPPPPRG